MKILIPGGTGQLGHILRRQFELNGDEVHLLSRHPDPNDENAIAWDAESLGPWVDEIEWADVVINLAGRSVNCRYSKKNLTEMMNSRVNSTRLIGKAIRQTATPPCVWLQMSTATIYAHRFDAPNTEATGLTGGSERDVPRYWKQSIDIAQAWEQSQSNCETPQTRQVALRSAMVMSPDKGGVFNVLSTLTRLGLGGPIGDGQQYVSWIHEFDFVDAIQFLIHNENLDGPVNLTSPSPIPQRQFMMLLRRAWNAKVGLPATKWMAEIGAFILRTDTELLLKSRRVVPEKIQQSGFRFLHPDWREAAIELVKRSSKSTN